ncbi:hypothetical protein QUF70_00970 [Desulfobacterales bacterium HSG17]|nr:hypothetical protein [Desulfobacterales bacterium HSG17]
MGCVHALETIGTVCHEMNQPLMAGLGYVDLLEQDFAETKIIKHLREEVEKLSLTTKRLLSISHYHTVNYAGTNTRILSLVQPSDGDK